MAKLQPWACCTNCFTRLQSYLTVGFVGRTELSMLQQHKQVVKRDRWPIVLSPFLTLVKQNNSAAAIRNGAKWDGCIQEDVCSTSELKTTSKVAEDFWLHNSWTITLLALNSPASEVKQMTGSLLLCQVIYQPGHDKVIKSDAAADFNVT